MLWYRVVFRHVEGGRAQGGRVAAEAMQQLLSKTKWASFCLFYMLHCYIVVV
jgi:hypothetical protein